MSKAEDTYWGPVIENIALVRVNARGEESFRLAADHVDLRLGGSDLNRLPIMGPSGAGKSTLLNLLSCISFPQKPNAKVTWNFPDGYACKWGRKGPARDNLIKLRQDYFGYAFQTASLQPQLNIAENLTFGLENAGVSHDDALDQAREGLVSVFGGNTKRANQMLSRYDSEVSGGERQRISLLQAFIRDPYVLFADEPTGSLDKDTRSEVMALLQAWLAKKPKERLLFWVTHHESDPQDNSANRRLFVADGAIRWQSLRARKWQAQEPPGLAAE